MELARTPDESPLNWRDATFEQGRTLSWLARKTGKSASTVYAYSRGLWRPSDEWMAQVAGLLGEDVAHVAPLEVPA